MHSLDGRRRTAQPAAEQRFHDHDGQAPGGGELQALCARLVLRVHVVVLNLAERPAVVTVDDVTKAFVIVVERKPEVADASVANRRLGFFQELVFQDELVPALFIQGVEQIEINVIDVYKRQIGV